MLYGLSIWAVPEIIGVMWFGVHVKLYTRLEHTEIRSTIFIAKSNQM
jgi:hypothetical protein